MAHGCPSGVQLGLGSGLGLGLGLELCLLEARANDSRGGGVPTCRICEQVFSHGLNGQME